MSSKLEESISGYLDKNISGFDIAMVVCGIVLVGAFVYVQPTAKQRPAGDAATDSVIASRNSQITPSELGLPEGNIRTSEPFVARRYKTDDEKNILDQQPDGFVKTVGDGYRLGKNETIRVHKGVDFSSFSRDGAAPTPMEYKSGVYGKVIKAGGGDWNTITVQLADGSVIQYLHSGVVYVTKGQDVSPDTPLGLTGKVKATKIHLHVQARASPNGVPIHPDEAFLVGRRKPQTTIDWPEIKWADFDVRASSVGVPNIKVVDGVVRIESAKGSKSGKTTFSYDEKAIKSTEVGKIAKSKAVPGDSPSISAVPTSPPKTKAKDKLIEVKGLDKFVDVKPDSPKQKPKKDPSKTTFNYEEKAKASAAVDSIVGTEWFMVYQNGSQAKYAERFEKNGLFVKTWNPTQDPLKWSEKNGKIILTYGTTGPWGNAGEVFQWLKREGDKLYLHDSSWVRGDVGYRIKKE
jgi:hypothetical protein